eukprot:s180_g40.t1
MSIPQDGSGQFWIIANNWLPVSFPIVWDLKGSSAGRANGLHDHGQKDNDWRDADKKIALSPDQRDRVLQALESETRYGNTGWASDSNCGSLSLVWGVKCTDFSI